MALSFGAPMTPGEFMRKSAVLGHTESFGIEIFRASIPEKAHGFLDMISISIRIFDKFYLLVQLLFRIG